MPRNPEVCPAAFCPLSHFSNIASRVLRFLAPVFSSSCLLLVLLITHHSGLITVHAQGTTATLSGTVTDQNGAVIPDVSIAVINIAQGFQRSATTNGEGDFVVPLLPPGNYTVKAEHEGFTPTEVRDVVLNVNDQVVMRIHMNVGTVSQTVQIVEGSSLINESPAVGTVVDRQFVANLPLNGRSFQSLITLTPGVVLTKTNVAQQGQFSINGQRPNTNYFTVDGVSANIGASGSSVPGPSGAGALPGLSASGGTNNLVSIDALEEFRIQTSTYAPEFGRTPGAQVSIVTRSGTNRFRGSVFNYFRNDALDANDWFVNRAGQPKPALRQNDFGGVLGGPIVKDRTFFFFSYEGLRLRQPQFGITDVPSLASRQVAPAAVQPLLNAYPKPNGLETTNGLARFSSGFSNPTTLNATSIRIDETVGSKLTLFGRYNYAPSESVSRGGPTQSLNTVTHFKVRTQTLTFGAISLLSSKISNDLRFNYSRNKAEGFFTVDDFGDAIVPADTTLFPQNQSSADGQFFLGIGSAALFKGVAPAELNDKLIL